MLKINITEQDVRTLFIGLLLFEISIVLVFLFHLLLGSPVEVFNNFFHLDREANIPAWFSSMQLFMIGMVFFLTGYRSQSQPVVLSRTVLAFLAVAFVFLSVDETASIHEKMHVILKHREWMPSLKIGLWIPIYLFLIVLITIAIYPHIKIMWAHFPREAKLLVMGTLIFLLGAVGIEIVADLFLRHDIRSIAYGVEVAIEELLEMAGASVILYGALLFAIRSSDNLGPRQ